MKNSRSGFTLIEVVVSMALLVLVLSGLIGVMLVSQETKVSTKNNLIATNLAQEGIDLVRFIRDQHYYNGDTDIFADIYEGSGDPEEVYRFTITTDKDGAIKTNVFSEGAVKDSDTLEIFEHRYLYSDDDAAIQTPFRRLITTTYDSAGSPPSLKVISEVYWQSDSKQNTITANDELTDWRP
jgi:prepilin-type N-terminal cleavage/methylation domain-containing protein